MAAAQPKPAEQIKRTAQAVEKHSRKVAHSAAETKHAAAAIESSADLNTRLAADRNILAAERTYAAWVRTGLFALASGIGARALLHGVLPGWLVLADASMLIAFSTFCFGVAAGGQLNPGAPAPRPQIKRIPPALLIAMNAFLALVSLAALIGILFGTPAGSRLPPG